MAPELTHIISHACPRHSIALPLREDKEVDYSKDSYFDKYRGYDRFRI